MIKIKLVPFQIKQSKIWVEKHCFDQVLFKQSFPPLVSIHEMYLAETWIFLNIANESKMKQTSVLDQLQHHTLERDIL